MKLVRETNLKLDKLALNPGKCVVVGNSPEKMWNNQSEIPP